MHDFPLRDDSRRKQRLMRGGLTVTGLGLGGLLIGVGLVIESASLPAVVLGAIICIGLALTAIGFGIMVVAADPFADDEVASSAD